VHWIHRPAEEDAHFGVAVEQLICGDVRIGHFRCGPGSTAWAEDNQIGDGALLVVPHRAVEITQAGRETVIASAAQAVFYRGQQVYRRRLIDPRGDDCVFVRLADATWSRLLGELAPEPVPTFCRGPIRPALYHRFNRFMAELHAGVMLDRLALEEALLPIIDALLDDAARAHELRRGQPHTHMQLGLAAEEFVVMQFRGDWGLDDIAATLEVSPAHLARVFRRHVGTAMHQHRIRLRLCAAIEELADSERSLTELALELGFASPSHFSELFHRTLGVPPSTLRGAGVRRRRAAREVARGPSRISKARSRSVS
jgi:AraC family transcriptional regulator